MNLQAEKDKILSLFTDTNMSLQPSELDRLLYGRDRVYETLLTVLSDGIDNRLRDNYTYAMGELVEDNTIRAWCDETGWHYQLVEQNKDD